MKFKKILAGAMAGTMVLASVTGVSAATSVDDLTCEGWWTDFTDGFALTEGTELTITGTTTNESTNNWNNMIFILFSGDGTVNGTDYVEYFVGRADDYGWGTATYEVTSYPDDWDTWLATTQAGAEFTLTATYTDGTITIVSSCEGAEYTATYTVEDSSLSYYIALSGELCTLSNLSATGTTTITLSDSEIGLLTGNSKTVSVTPAYAECTVVSADESIATATVADDVVTITAVAAGSTTVTVTSGSSSQEITVDVSDEAIALTAITASASSTELTVGGTSTISVAATPSNTTEDIVASYASSDEDILTVSESGVVTAVAAGTATVTVSVINEAGETLTSTVDFTVTEAESESEEESATADEVTATTTTTDDSSSDSTESTETASYTTVVKTVELDDLTAEDFWTVFSEGLDLVEGQQIVITGTTTNNSTNNWNNVLFVLYSSDDGAIYAADSDEATAANYVEYFVGRIDNYGWGTATYEVTSEPDDWDAWLAATQAGAEFTITVTYVDGTIQITSACEGAEYVVTYTVEDADATYYVALTGEQCTLTDLVATYYEADEESIVETTTSVSTEEDDTTGSGSTTTTTTTTTTTSTTGSANTGDASPIIPIAVAVLGCGAVVVASKKRMA